MQSSRGAAPGPDQGAPEVFVGPYILEQTLGKGTTGKVKKGHHRQTRKQVAIKVVRKSLLAENLDVRQRVEREIKILRLLHHPFIMRCYDVMQTTTHLFIVMEHLEHGELYDYVLSRSAMSVEEAFKFFYQIVKGVQYMHSQNICHRDLKLENLLLDSRHNVRIADFGMASAMPRGKQLETSCGSPHYACPEIVRGDRYFGNEADVWSVGVLLYAISTSSLPFDDENIEALFERIKRADYSCPPALPVSLRDLIGKMLRVEGSERISLDEVTKHAFWRELIHTLPSDASEEAQMKLMTSAMH